MQSRLCLLFAGLALLASVSASSNTEISCAPKVPCSYTVVEGDSLWKISEHFGVELSEVVKLNPQFSDPNLIHPGDHVKLPCKVAATSGSSVADLLANRHDMTILLKAATAAGFAETLSDPNLVATVFAPSNCYFKRLLAELGMTAEQLLADTKLLSSVLSYHVVPGVAAKAADLTDGQVLPTLLKGQSLGVQLERGHVFLETTSDQQVKVIKADLAAGKAVVHIVNEVLLPAEDGAADDEEEAAAGGCTHTVKEGEYLDMLAQKHGITLDDLIKLNPEVEDPELIHPGDKINVPC